MQNLCKLSLLLSLLWFHPLLCVFLLHWYELLKVGVSVLLLEIHVPYRSEVMLDRDPLLVTSSRCECASQFTNFIYFIFSWACFSSLPQLHGYDWKEVSRAKRLLIHFNPPLHACVFFNYLQSLDWFRCVSSSSKLGRKVDRQENRSAQLWPCPNQVWQSDNKSLKLSFP